MSTEGAIVNGRVRGINSGVVMSGGRKVGSRLETGAVNGHILAEGMLRWGSKQECREVWSETGVGKLGYTELARRRTPIAIQRLAAMASPKKAEEVRPQRTFQLVEISGEVIRCWERYRLSS